MATTTFDDSLARFAEALAGARMDISADSGVIVRDMRGRLSFVASGELAPDVVSSVRSSIPEDLLPFVSPLGPVADSTFPGAQRALGEADPIRRMITLTHQEHPVSIKLLDRRVVGEDWLHVPEGVTGPPPRLVFASLKGGVGRSTALCVLAAELAERGHAILVLDLDLEAPGIGSMLIEPAATPRFGSIDFFVENTLHVPDDGFLLDCLGASWLGGGRGRVDVVPSIGAASIENPRDVLSKLARAYLESEGQDGKPCTFLGNAQALVSRLSKLRRYDAILIDARSGLHESTAAAILGLGADVLLFGLNQPQTLLGYKILLAHLSQLPVRDSSHDWRYRLRMAQAKAENDTAVSEYRARTFDLFDAELYEAHSAQVIDALADNFRFGIDDQDAPHFAIPIYEDERYRIFDPVQHRAQLTAGLYSKGFGSFIDFCLERLQLDEGATQ